MGWKRNQDTILRWTVGRAMSNGKIETSGRAWLRWRSPGSGGLAAMAGDLENLSCGVISLPLEEGHVMALSFTVGGARGTFDGRFADEVADVLDNAFGAEGEWEGSPPLHYGELADTGWSELQRRAIEALGVEAIPNLTALGNDGRGVYLPAQLQAISLPLSAGGTLKCASLLGLRHELAELAERWELPLDDDGLHELAARRPDPDDGWVAEPPEVMTFARLTLAANEALRRDCPLWLVGQEVVCRGARSRSTRGDKRRVRLNHRG